MYQFNCRQQQNSLTTTTTKHTLHHGRRFRILDLVPYSCCHFQWLSRHYRQHFNKAKARNEMGAWIGGCCSNIVDLCESRRFNQIRTTFQQMEGHSLEGLLFLLSGACVNFLAVTFSESEAVRNSRTLWRVSYMWETAKGNREVFFKGS